MPLLLDTNILIAFFEERMNTLRPELAGALRDPDAEPIARVASLWEIAIKVAIHKLALAPTLRELPRLLDDLGIELLAIEARHVLEIVDPMPATRDPFDCLLLAQCVVENLRLVTFDRILAAHPLAWRLS